MEDERNMLVINQVLGFRKAFASGVLVVVMATLSGILYGSLF